MRPIDQRQHRCTNSFLVNALMVALKPHSNMMMVHWPLVTWLLHLVQRGGAWAGCGHSRCTKCNNPPINDQLCGLRAIKKLKARRYHTSQRTSSGTSLKFIFGRSFCGFLFGFGSDLGFFGFLIRSQTVRGSWLISSCVNLLQLSSPENRSDSRRPRMSTSSKSFIDVPQKNSTTGLALSPADL